jgi:hypothetical protein
MGSGVGVHNPEDLGGLTAADRVELKKEIMRQLQHSSELAAMIGSDPQASADVAKIISSDPTLLETLMERHPNIKNKVTELVAPLLQQLRGGS